MIHLTNRTAPIYIYNKSEDKNTQRNQLQKSFSDLTSDTTITSGPRQRGFLIFVVSFYPVIKDSLIHAETQEDVDRRIKKSNDAANELKRINTLKDIMKQEYKIDPAKLAHLTEAASSYIPKEVILKNYCMFLYMCIYLKFQFYFFLFFHF